jgi:hypothetical protein
LAHIAGQVGVLVFYMGFLFFSGSVPALEGLIPEEINLGRSVSFPVLPSGNSFFDLHMPHLPLAVFDMNAHSFHYEEVVK